MGISLEMVKDMICNISLINYNTHLALLSSLNLFLKPSQVCCNKKSNVFVKFTLCLFPSENPIVTLTVRA